MTLKELKEYIESRNIPDSLIIFKNSESHFICNQYIHAIKNIKYSRIDYVDSLDSLIESSYSNLMFDMDVTETNSLKVAYFDTFSCKTDSIKRLKDTIIVVDKFQDKETETLLKDYIVYIPSIEEWMMKDYVYSVTEGLSSKNLDWLLSICGNNYDRLQMELDKLNLFNKDEKEYVFADMVRDGEFDDLTSYNIFSLTNAIISKDINTICNIYKDIDRIDINEFGLLTILLKNFKNIMSVQLSSNPTSESTGLSDKQLYVFKKLPKVYTPKQLVDIYEMLLDIDRKIKTGELSTNFVVDYMITRILGE